MQQTRHLNWKYVLPPPPSPHPIGRITGRKYRYREIVALRSKVLNMASSRTLVENTNWSHSGQKYRSEFLAIGWPNWVKIPGEKLHAPLVPKFRSARLAPCTLQSTIPALRNLAPVVRKVSFQALLPVLVAPWQKIPIRYFRSQNRKIVERNFTHHWCKVQKCRRGTLHSAECQPGTSDQMGKIRKFSPGGSSFFRNFGPVMRKVSFQHFLPVFGCPMAKNFDSVLSTGCNQLVLLTVVPPKAMFDTFDHGVSFPIGELWQEVRQMAG